MPESPTSDTNATRFEGSGAEILRESLIRAGVTTLFGVPGDTGMAWYDALYHASDRIEHVLVRDERHAATMADVFTRVTNTVGVVEVSGGGGTTYVVGGLGEPFAASVPVLLITSDIHSGSRGTGALTEIDQISLFSAVTKWRERASRAADIPELVDQALHSATKGRPAPVALIIPEDILDEQASVLIDLYKSAVQLPSDRLQAQGDAVERASVLLRDALRPAIVTGGGLHSSQAWNELADLADHAGIPVATTIAGKGSLPETNPWCLGVVGANGARPYANSYLASSDVVLFVGTRANATDTNSFTCPPRDGTCAIIQIDIDAERAGRNYPNSLGLAGDAQAVLKQLREVVPASKPERRESLLGWISAEKESWVGRSQASQPSRTDADSSSLDPREVLATLATVSGPDVLLIADCGTPTPNVASYWEVARAGRRVIAPRGHGPMGYAIPGAIGAARALPGEPVLAITTDGSLAMAGGELETASRLDLPILFVQLTNHSLGWIKMLQHLYLDGRYFGVDPGPIDAVGLARACGLDAAHVDSLSELKEVALSAFNSGRPTYLEVEVPSQLTLPPPVAPWQAALAGKDTQRPVY